MRNPPTRGDAGGLWGRVASDTRCNRVSGCRGDCTTPAVPPRGSAYRPPSPFRNRYSGLRRWLWLARAVRAGAVGPVGVLLDAGRVHREPSGIEFTPVGLGALARRPATQQPALGAQARVAPVRRRAQPPTHSASTTSTRMPSCVASSHSRMRRRTSSMCSHVLPPIMSCFTSASRMGVLMSPPKFDGVRGR